MKEVHDHSFNVNVAEYFRSVEKAILLKEFYGWIKINKDSNRNIHYGVAWTYNSAEALNEKFRYMHPKSIWRWIDEMSKDGFICINRFNEKRYDKTNWYTINWVAYLAICEGKSELIEEALNRFKSFQKLVFDSQNEKSISQNKKRYSQNEESISQSKEPIPSLTNSLTSPPNEFKNDFLIKTKEEFEGLGITGYEIFPSTPSLTPPPNSEAPPAHKKERKSPKYIYPPTIEELVKPIYEKLLAKKRDHPNIVDCWNWANHQAEAFWLYHDKTGWKVEKLNSAIATWINKAIQYKTVVVPCPIQYKGNPANAQPVKPTKVHVEETKSPEQSKEARKAMFAAAKAELNQIGL